ncbi:Beta-lactamase superfamily domain containing protein [Candidatus Pelagibacterales bacterium]|jgi:UDP-MurNAc hydroxylase
MKIKLYRSATVGIEIENFKILQDPWLTDGEYYGSWSHFPYFDLKKNIQEINSYNAIYISHIHPDHCSEDTLSLIRKDIPVYIHEYHSKFLKFKLERLKFKVIELKNGKKQEICKNIYINIFAADNCNPELCYRFLGCADLSAKGKSQQIDTLSIINNETSSLINVNDCPFDLAKSTFKDIHKEYKKIDILLTGYQNASPYPQCFDNLNLSEKKTLGKKIAINCMNKSLNFIKNLKPRYFLPFAGTYALSGILGHLNNLRGVPNIDEAYEYLSKNQSISQPIKMNPSSVFDLTNAEVSPPYKKFNNRNYKNYIKNFLLKKELTYEKFPYPKFDEIFELSKKSYLKFLYKKSINNIKINSDIYIEIFDKLIKIPKEDTPLEFLYKNNLKKNKGSFVLYKTDPRLLKWLLMGPKYAHWNNAEIGSHINFFRYPDIFERNVYASMCYFHC